MNRTTITMRVQPSRWLLAIAVVLAWTTVASAQLPPTVVRVEEDWELTIGTPDPDTDAPQIACVISPLGNVESLYAALELNQQSIPSFAAGGLQLQLWDGEVPLSEHSFPNGATMAQTGEVVRWTQSMRLQEGNLVFEILNGSSASWSDFGGQGYLKAIVPTTLDDLNAYSPAVSVANSGVNYAANRVQSLILKRVRYYTSTGQMVEDTTERVVHSQD